MVLCTFASITDNFLHSLVCIAFAEFRVKSLCGYEYGSYIGPRKAQSPLLIFLDGTSTMEDATKEADVKMMRLSLQI